MHAGIYTRSEPAPITVLVGDHVFRGESIIEVCSKHLLEEPTPPSARCDHPIPQALERLVLDCLENSAIAAPSPRAPSWSVCSGFRSKPGSRGKTKPGGSNGDPRSSYRADP
jgi:hypothetical protein